MKENKNKNLNAEQLILKHQKRMQTIKVTEFICTGVLLLAILASLIVVVVIQFSCGNESYQVAAEICNTYTGIVLGFVAMTVSLIGMILSFHNTKQSEESNLATAIEFINLKHSVSDIEKNLSQTLDELERKTIDMEKFKSIEKRLEELASEMRISYDKNKGSATDKATTTDAKREYSSEPMETDEGHE